MVDMTVVSPVAIKWGASSFRLDVGTKARLVGEIISGKTNIIEASNRFGISSATIDTWYKDIGLSHTKLSTIEDGVPWISKNLIHGATEIDKIISSIKKAK